MTAENGKSEAQVTEEQTTEENLTEQEAQTQKTLLDEEGGIEVADDSSDSELQKQVEDLTEQLALAKDQALRAHAESQNTKRRAQQDVEKAHKFALEKFVDALIPVVDSLEKGIESAEQAEGSHEGIIEGMNLTLKQFLSALEKSGVKQVDPAGQPFDPNFHQAMSMVPNPDMEPNTVMDVFQKGYTLNDRLVRPAMVVVSK